MAIMGPSGSGKTTLMNIVGCLDLPTSGTYILDGRPVSELKEKELTRVRRDTIDLYFRISSSCRESVPWTMYACHSYMPV